MTTGKFSRLGRFVGLATIVATAGSAHARRIQPDDVASIVSVSDPQIAPDGRSIVCVVSRPDLEHDRTDNELVLVDIATGAQRVLTHDRKGVGSPRWSPAGDRLAFVASVPSAKTEAPQIFILPMNGGDATAITNASNGVEQFAWRPDGTDIAYVTSDEPPNKAAIEKHEDAFEVGDNDYLTTSAPTPSHIWLVSATSGVAKRLTSGAWSVPKSAPPSPPASPIGWSPNGKLLTFVRQEHPHWGDYYMSTVQILDVASGAIRKLTKHTWAESVGVLSPDGSRTACLYSRDGDMNNVSDAFVTSTSGGDGLPVSRKLDRNFWRVMWMPDGASLLLSAHDGTKTAMWIQPLQGEARRLDLGDVSPTVWFWFDAAVSASGAIAFTGSTPTTPTELYYMAKPEAAPRRLTSFNKSIAALSLGKTEAIEWAGPDGFHEDGVLFLPPDFKKETKYPVVLLIHGGPTFSTSVTFDGLAQVLAGHGYVVFAPNYRGSDNLGNDYMRAVFNDATEGPGRDIIAGLDAVERLGFVDKSRIAVSGWSYGGTMTTWLVGHHHFWKAAVIGAPATDFHEQYNASDTNISWGYVFKGSPWLKGNIKDYRAQSPITYASDITTPTLIMSDTGDARVPIIESYQLFHALKDNHVPVKFIAYPVAGHFPGDPVRTRDVIQRWVDWLAQYLK